MISELLQRVISPVGLGDISKGHNKQLIYLQQLLPRTHSKERDEITAHAVFS